MFGTSTKRSVAALVASTVLLTSCVAPRWEIATYDQFPLNWGRAQRGSALIKVIALTPGGGVLSEAIGTELAKRGFVIVPATTTQTLATDVDFTAVSERQARTGRSPGELWKLRHALYARGVDAFLIVRSHDFTPKSYLGRKYWQQAELELHSTTEENATSNGAIAGTSFANLLNDRPSSPSEAAVRMVMNLAIGPGGI
jgi:hypothetical protein